MSSDKTSKAKKTKSRKPKKNKQFVCVECGKQFTSQWNLTRHDNCVHKDLKQFKCDMCTKAYKRKRDLDGHKNAKHLHCMPYACQARGCDAAFPRRETLRSHMKKHRMDGDIESSDDDDRGSGSGATATHTHTTHATSHKRRGDAESLGDAVAESTKKKKTLICMEEEQLREQKMRDKSAADALPQYSQFIEAAEADNLILHDGRINALVDGRVFSLGLDDHGPLHEHIDDCDDCSEGRPVEHGDCCEGGQPYHHEDHWDWLIGHHLHHPTDHGCQNHGHVPRLKFEDALKDESWQELFAASDLTSRFQSESPPKLLSASPQL